MLNPVRVRGFGMMFLPLLVFVGSCAARSHPTHVATASVGERLYVANCSVCHGAAGVGTRIGPSLVGIRARLHGKAIRAAILRPTPPMPRLVPGQISEADVADIIVYLRTL